MEPDNKYLNLKKITAICSAFLLFFAVGCDNNTDQQQETQAYQQPQQEAVAEFDENDQPETDETEEVEAAPATTTRTNYRPRITRSSDKLTLDATDINFRDLDENNNYIVSREDLFDGIFNTFDTEEGNTISEEEFNNSKDDFFVNKNSKEVANFSNWDADGDGEISREEFHNKLNSLIDLEEGRDLPQGTYIVWDLDNDDKIEMLELENFVVKFDTNDN